MSEVPLYIEERRRGEWGGSRAVREGWGGGSLSGETDFLSECENNYYVIGSYSSNIKALV